MKWFFMILSLLTCVTGCAREEKMTEPNNDQVVEEKEEFQEENTISDETFKESENLVKKDDLSNDEYVINYFTEVSNEVDAYINAKENKTISEKLLNSLITCVDFLFYDQEIGGVKLSDITDKTKESLNKILVNIDQKLEQAFPNYKVYLSEKYDHLKISLKNFGEKTDTYLEDKIGSDKYAEYKEDINKVIDITKDVGHEIKEKSKDVFNNLKNWYEEKTGKK